MIVEKTLINIIDIRQMFDAYISTKTDVFCFRTNCPLKNPCKWISISVFNIREGVRGQKHPSEA